MTGTRKRLLINLCLLALVIGAGWMAYQQVQKDNSGVDTLYTDTIGDTMREIRILVPGKDELVLSAEGEDWFITQPIQAKANPKSLRHLLTMMAEPILKTYEVEGKALETYDLGDAAIRVTFNDVEYVFGKLNPVNRQRYILLENKILMANEVVYELLNRGVDGFKEEK
ncbi:hypothetical protein [Leucothrix arctica]|uniref:DUF4340 domain-containing protein n=1 Tax=Leucothrix arctica TaxID=1481894 RepID=A0A317CII3_9GAMM|nr:hypothetical protein [Leucothrix arctica]PWQ98306.1 hypothetical protein DKT75_04010 [Leucothrix arctica]